MGSCFSSQSSVIKIYDSFSNANNHPEENNNEADSKDEDYEALESIVPITQNAKQQAHFLTNNFVMISLIAEKLKETVFQESTLKDMIKSMFDFIKKASIINISGNAKSIQKLLTPEIIKQIVAERIYYGQIIKMNSFKTIIERKEAVQTDICSLRLYHEIANIKKEIDYNQRGLIQQFFKFQVNKAQRLHSDSGFIEISNNYRKLSAPQIDEAVFLQVVSNLVQQTVQKIKFRYDSSKQQFKEVGELITNIFSQFSLEIERYKYDLCDRQIESISRVSRRACDFYQDGVYILLIYLKRSCANLERDKVLVQDIQNKLKSAIDKISKKYPPGSGLVSSQKDLLQRLQNIELKQGKNQFKPFIFREYSLGAENRSQQLNSIILSQARIASSYRQDFQALIIKTCLKRCILYKTGLKLDPNRPNNKATIRIQQKMLFKGDQPNQNQPSKLQSTIQETLQAAQNEYKQKLSNRLQGMSTIKFTISDMLRGKCTFLSIQEILQTINEIKQYVKAINEQNGISLRIVQIQSRFTNPMPISDITLKIAINQEILTQLQLTIQTNLATYFFAHKVYELQRTQIFSKLKIVHNYQNQFRKDFAQVIKQRLRIAKIKKENSINQKSKICADFFELSKIKILQFNTILEQFIQQQRQNIKISKQMKCFNPQIQDFIRINFQLKMNTWNIQFGKILNQTLGQNHTKIYNQMAFFCFLRQLQTVERIQQIQQFTLDNHQQIKSRYQEDGDSLISVFLQKQFEIDYSKFLEYPHTARLYYLFQFVLNMLTFASANIYSDNIKKILSYQVEFIRFNYRFPLDIIYGDASKQTLNQLIIYSKLGFEAGQFHRVSTQALTLLQILTKQNHNLKKENIQLQILRAQYNLEYDSPDQAVNTLLNLRLLSKELGNYEAALQCSFLLMQAKLNISKFDTKNDYDLAGQYSMIQQESIVIGLPLYSKEIIQSQLRIADLCSRISSTKKLNSIFGGGGGGGWDKLAAFHLSKAVDYLWNFKDISFMWNLYQKRNYQLAYRQNTKAKSIRLSQKKLQTKGCQFLSYLKWSNLTLVHIACNNINADGCEYIRTTQWSNLQILNMRGNKIRAEGCQFLSEGNWPKLKELNLRQNKIQDKGCKYLIQGKWPTLADLNLEQNQIKAEGCNYLANSNWPNLLRLDLSLNSLKEAGCKNLASAKWSSLTSIGLRFSLIGVEGCKYLSNANWPNLSHLNLKGQNNFNAEGMKLLSSAKWPNLTEIVLPFECHSKEEIDRFSPHFKQSSIKFI